MKTAPLTPKLSAHARRELGLSQNDVIKATGIQAYKLKMFEGRHMPLQLSDSRKLTAFYGGELERVGSSLDDLRNHLAHAGQLETDVETGSDEPPSPTPQKRTFTANPRPGFFISPDLPEAVVDGLMVDMEASDDRIAELLNEALQRGFLGGLSDATVADVQQLFGHLAANHIRFRFLQGRSVLGPMREEAKTIGDYLTQWVQSQGVRHVLPDVEAVAPAASAARLPAPVTVDDGE